MSQKNIQISRFSFQGICCTSSISRKVVNVGSKGSIFQREYEDIALYIDGLDVMGSFITFSSNFVVRLTVSLTKESYGD